MRVGNAFITPADIDQGDSSDACGIASLALDIDSFDCSNVGPNTVTLTVTDNNNNVSTATAVVTVEDNVDPIAVANDITVQLDASGNVSITPADIDQGDSSDACDIQTLALDITSFTCANVGPNTVTLTVTDNNNNVSTATAVVTVEDNVDPIAVANDITVQLDASGNASITPADIDQGDSSDACDIQTLALDITSFTCANVGLNTVTLTVTDNNDNVSTATAVVTVEDNVDPIAVAQPLTVQLDDNGLASITPEQIDNGSNDACGIASLALDIDSFGCDDVNNPVTVTLTVTDNNNNISTATALVTVLDEIDPVIACPEVQVYLDASGDGSLDIEQIRPFLSDNCTDSSELSIDLLGDSSFDCGSIGENLPDLIISQAINGLGAEDAIEIYNGTGLAVDLSTYSLNVGGTSYALGGSVADRESYVIGSGFNFTNTEIQSAQRIAFPFAFATDMTFSLDKNGASIDQVNYSGEANLKRDASIGLGNVSFNLSEWTTVGSNDYSNLGAHAVDVQSNEVDIKVTDANGNESFCTVRVTVIDDSAPIAQAKAITVQLDASGNASIAGADINDGSSDACGIASLEVIGETAFTCEDVGRTDIEVTLLVTDNNGNTTESSPVQITVEDKVAPVVVTKDITIQLDSNGQTSIAEDAVNDGSSDSCGGLEFDTDITSFDCSNVGENTVTLTVTDVNGNSSTATAIVTVEDNVKPIAVTKDITIEIIGGTASIVAEDINDGSNDNCDQELTLELLGQSEFSCADVGTDIVVQLQVTDDYDNVSDPVNATITVIGEVPSIASITPSELPEFCQGAFIVLSANLDATPIMTEGVSYQWSKDGAELPGETLSTLEVSEDGAYTVRVTSNRSACSTEESYTVAGLNTEDLLASYTILATKKVELKDANTVETGGVGVTGANEEIKVKKASTIAGFARASKIEIDNSSSVGSAILSPADVEIPEFLYNNLSTGSSPEVKVENNQTELLTESVYEKVEVKDGATAIFTQSNVYIKELKTKKNATVEFSSCANVFIDKKLKLEEGTIFNSAGYQVTIYVDDDVEIKENSEITARIHANDNKIEIRGKKKKNQDEPIFMTGLFIAKEVKSERNVIWNSDSFCEPCAVDSNVDYSKDGFTDTEDGEASRSGSSLKVEAYPNPSSGDFN